MKKLYLSLASVPMFAGFAVANANEPTPAETPLNEPITLNAATLDDITAAGTNGGKERWKSSGDQTFQFNQPILSPQTNLALQVGVLSYQNSEQSNFQGNIND